MVLHIYLYNLFETVLRRIDVLRAQGVKGDKFNSDIVKADHKYLFPTSTAAAAANSNNQDKDLISHFVLRMAYCRTEELRKWFLANESQLFAIRLENAKSADVDAFLDANNLKYPPVRKLFIFVSYLCVCACRI